MDPVQGRIVIHWHLGDGGPIIAGPLSQMEVMQPVVGVLQGFAAELNAARAGVFVGPLVMRLVIAASGQVKSCDILVDRVKRLDGGHPGPEPHVAKLQAQLSALAFPSSAGETRATLPVVFGGDLRPLET